MKKITFLMAFLAILSWQVNAQTIIIGSGTTSTTSTGSDPIDGYFESFRYQVIYTASELTAAGLPLGADLTGLGFSINGDYGGGNLNGYTIKLGHTSDVNSATHCTSSTIEVKAPFAYNPTVTAVGVFDMIPFSTNFTWDGVSNILVDICSSGPNAYTSPYGQVRTLATTTTNGSRYVRADAAGSQCGVNTGTTNSTKPQISFSYTLASCLKPISLTALNITTTTADLGWTEIGTATSWNIEWGATGFIQGTGTMVTGTTTNPNNIIGLSANTSYQFYVQADCGGSGTSNWAGPFTFTTPPACPSPSALAVTALTATSANLGWTENGTATTWNIEWGVTGFTQGTGTMVTGTNTNPHNVNTLSPTTTYQFYVQADCGGSGTSAWTGPFSFTTPCAAVVAPWNETFENAGLIPACWKQGAANAEPWKFSNTGTGNHIGNNGTITGTTSSNGYFAWVDDSSPHSLATTLESPLIDVSALTTPELSFYLLSNNETYTNVNFSVNVWDGATWNVGYYTHNTNTTSGAWEKIIVNLSSLTISGPIQFRFIVDESNGTDFYDDVAIDDVDLHEAPACIAPTTLTATAITSGSADVGWTSAVGTWNIEWGTTGFTQGTGTMITGTTTNPYSLGGLPSNTSYQFYVQADCGGSGTSTWTGPFTFITLPDYCAGDHFYDNGGAAGNYTNNVTNETTVICPSTPGDVVTAIFNSFDTEAGWDDLTVYDGNGTGGTSFGTFDGTTIPGPFISTDVTGCLTFVFNSDGSGTRAGWDATITCTPAPTCAQPSALTATAITSGSASLGWTENGTATTWNIEWDTAGFTPTGTPTITGTMTNPHNLGSLSPNTSYQFYVQADCGGSGTSTWAGPFTFTTPCVAPVISSFPWTENFDGVSTPAIPCGWIVDNVNADAYTWVTGSNLANSAPNSMEVRWNSAQAANDWSFTPELVLVGGQTYELSFAYAVAGSSFPEKLKVMYGTAQNVAGMTTLLFDSTLTNTTYNTAYATFTPATSGSYFIGFHNYSDADMFRIYVDDVTLKEAVPCSLPSNLTAFNITQTSAMLDWTENGTATEWNIEWGIQGFTLGTGTPEHVTAKPYLLNGLMPSTPYSYYVQADCGTDSSAWVGPFNFMTPPCMPIGLELGADTTLCSGQSLTLNAPTGGPYGWTWSTTESTPSITVDTASLGGNGTYNITINMIDFSTTCTYNDNINVTFTVCTGVDEIASASSFTVYPNPTTGLFTVSTTHIEKATIEVINLQGKVVYKNNINSNNQVIDLRENAKGVYFVSITSTNGVDVLKIIVQ